MRSTGGFLFSRLECMTALRSGRCRRYLSLNISDSRRFLFSSGPRCSSSSSSSPTPIYIRFLLPVNIYRHVESSENQKDSQKVYRENFGVSRCPVNDSQNIPIRCTEDG